MPWLSSGPYHGCTVIWESTSRILSLIAAWNPFMTERTTIRMNTPRNTIIIESSVLEDTIPWLFFDFRYRNPINNS